MLGYSRLFWLRFCRQQTIRVLFDGLETAFRFFGGVRRELLFDQMEADIVDDERSEGGRAIEMLSSCALLPTGGFGFGRAVHIGPVPRARWSVR